MHWGLLHERIQWDTSGDWRNWNHQSKFGYRITGTIVNFVKGLCYPLLLWGEEGLKERKIKCGFTERIGTKFLIWLFAKQCSTSQHHVTLQAPTMPKDIRQSGMSTIVQPSHMQKCRAHRSDYHNFFLSYRVNAEGVKCPLSQVVCVFTSYPPPFLPSSSPLVQLPPCPPQGMGGGNGLHACRREGGG